MKRVHDPAGFDRFDNCILALDTTRHVPGVCFRCDAEDSRDREGDEYEEPEHEPQADRINW